ncbi:hypothetical protein H0H81_005045 [Sphagnurus paluster]|uniref:Protein CPL1-like domain-containing protein n=1 Tax=Sphagnurus paluster TaxID=117069 RepID=A0A9P7FYT5_9AGAR|nr:hypothetical protein H0H81_005045 [Sphagnurus paluster]
MRLRHLVISPLLFLGPLAPSFVSAAGLISSAKGNVLARRQYRAPRDVSDVCVSVSGDVLARQGGVSNPDFFTAFPVSLCRNGLDEWMFTTESGEIFRELFGNELLVTQMYTLFASANGETCVFGEHAERIEVMDQPCAFECSDGYTADGNLCECAEPLSVCNGTCGSAAPNRKRRGVKRITTLAQAKATCKPKQSVCGIAGREDTFDFECIDTSTTLDSCGGCITPHPFYEPHRKSPAGIDCGRLPGVLTATCEESYCVVTQCRAGQQPSSDNTHCTKLSASQVSSSHSAEGKDPHRRKYKRAVPVNRIPSTSQLKSQLTAIVDSVITLDNVCHSMRHPATPPVLDYPALVQKIVDATAQLLTSSSVAEVVTNAKALAASNTYVKDQITACNCTRWLSLGPLVHKLDAFIEKTAGLQTYLKTHTVAKDTPNTSDAFIDLHSEVLLARISTNAVGSPAGASGVATPIIDQITHLASLVLALAESGSVLPAPMLGAPPVVLPVLATSQFSIDTRIIEALVSSVIALSTSTTAPALVDNINAFVEVNAAVARSLAMCGCVERLGLAKLVAAVDAVGNVGLGLKSASRQVKVIGGTIDLGLGAAAVVEELKALRTHH